MTPSRVELGAIAEFVNGAAFKPDEWSATGRRIIRIQNLTDPTKPFNRTTREVDAKLLVNPGDLLVSWSASLGVFEWSGSDIAVLNQHIFRVLPDERKVDRRYLRFALDMALRQMRRHLHGATMQHVNRGEFLSTRVYLPPLPEQRRIAAILDKADALRAKRFAALAKLDALPEATFREMFGDPVSNPKGWSRVNFSEVFDRIDSGWSPVCADQPASDDEWGVLKLGAVTWRRFDESENKALLNGTEPDLGLEVKEGDLLFVRKNTHDLVASAAYVWKTRPRLMLSDLIFRLHLRPGASADPVFLQQLLIFPSKLRLIQQLAGGSAGSMPNISKARLSSVRLEVPPLDLQRTFRLAMESIERLRRERLRSIAASDDLFGALQHRAFRGELAA